jgi:fructose-1,6-bisphosphatase I
MHYKSLTQVIIEQQRIHGGSGRFTALLNELEHACKEVAYYVNRGQLAGVLGAAGSENVFGESQKKLDVIANTVMVRSLEWTGYVGGLASEEMDGLYPIPPQYPRGRYLLIFDPLDGSSNIDANISVGTIFSILRVPEGVENPDMAHFLLPGTEQVAAGYCMYGSSTMMVITTGHGVNGFTLEPGIGEFILTHPDMRIPEETAEFSINTSNTCLWDEAIRRYIDDCLLGEEGPFKKKYNMRWVGTMVADVHRILLRGGIFMYPRDRNNPQGKLRLMYEANPMSMLVEQAGGIASTGFERILEKKPQALHEKTPVIMGSKNEVEKVLDYYRRYNG